MPRRATDLRIRLINRGMEILKVEGVESLSLRRVANDCNVSHGSPYKYFDNKDMYLNAIFDQLIVHFGEKMNVNIDNYYSAEEKLFAIGMNFINYSMDYPNYFKYLFLENTFAHLYINGTSIDTKRELPAMTLYKNIINSIIVDKDINLSSETIFIHLWSYITGLALIISKNDIENMKYEDIEQNIKLMISNYFNKR